MIRLRDFRQHRQERKQIKEMLRLENSELW